MEKLKTQLSGKRAIVEHKGAKSGTRGYCVSIYMAYHCPCNVQGTGAGGEWLRYWTLNHEIVGSGPALH